MKAVDLIAGVFIKAHDWFKDWRLANVLARITPMMAQELVEDYDMLAEADCVRVSIKMKEHSDERSA